MGEHVQDTLNLDVNTIKEIPKYKSFICKEQLKNNEKTFDKLDKKINETLINMKSKYKLKDLSKIKKNK